MSDIRHHAILWCRRGYYPVPIPYGKKGPTLKDWQHLHITEDDVPRYFNGAPLNVGVLQGEPYGNCDIDLDCPQAITAFPHFAPETGLIFGHQSKPRSHWFYRIDPPHRSVKYIDPVGHATLLEFRCLAADGGTGLQTLVPPSVHPSGEPIEFWRDCSREPANVDADELGHAVRWTAAVALLARHWPAAGGGRHDAFLALAGSLAHDRWARTEAARLVCGLYQTLWPGYADLASAMREVESTFERHDRGQEITGLPKLMQHVPPKVVRQAAKWLGLDREPTETAPPPADEEAPPEPPKKKVQPVFCYRNVRNVWTLEGGEIEYIIPDLLPAGAITLITGDSGHGKSMFATAMAGAIASGGRFLDRQCTQRKVLYLDREQPLAIVKQHLHDLGIKENPDWLTYWGEWEEAEADGPASVSLYEFARAEKPVMIFDSLIAFHPGDEQDASATRRYLHRYRALAAAGATICLLHHVGKAESAKQYRGSSDIKASVDVAFLLEKLGDPAGLLTELRLVPFKNRIGDSKQIALSFRGGEFVTSDRPESNRDIFERIVRQNPFLSGTQLVKLGMAAGLGKTRMEQFLVNGVREGWLQIKLGKGTSKQYALSEPILEF